MARGSSSPSNYLVLFLLSRFLVDCYSEVSSIRKLGAQVTSFPLNRRLDVDDDNVFPTPGTQTPTIVTVSPVLVTPTNPTTTPVSVPTMTPVIFPQTTPPVPVTVPVTNPVTTYPSPPNLPGTTTPVNPPATTYNPPATTYNPPATTYNPPATTYNPPAITPYNPVGPPATTTAPAMGGQSWCVARGGATEQALQAALDYACGIGGADCSQIQMGASCYSPITLQNHASYAFNSYYQRNPTATSCDFGGVAVVVNTNPSTGSCIFPTGSTSTAPTTTSPITTTPIVPTPTTDSSSSSSPVGVPVPTSSTGAPPNLFNTGNPASGFGYGNPPPPFSTDPLSVSIKTQPDLGCVIVLFVISAAAEMMLRI